MFEEIYSQIDVLAEVRGGDAALTRGHPDRAGIRDTWPDQPADPRLPLYTAPEKS